MSTMVKKQITVTKRNITSGVCADDRRCPIARAINRKTVAKASVRFGTVRFSNTGPNYKLPKKAEHFHDEFDLGIPVAPFNFMLSLPAELWAPDLKL